ncbi:MAG TPA: tRNA pseudouridine(55) synthase TruB [Verrucomicrobiae bacterium]|nr:tRNA pseudouridine(55) synthase TruB [Verrucomicrobiae bacterium]
MFDGILLIDKPKGWTSFDVVAKVRGMVRAETGQKKPKVGHTGTLDPLATGLLVLVLGKYTKRVPELSKTDKTYEVTMCLGQTSTTGDEEGEKAAVSDKVPSEQELLGVIRQFVGEISQIPPAYSAIKVNGQRAYKLARAGKEVVLESRKATIYSLELRRYAYPEVDFVVRVSSGTYIRTLVEDVGKKLGTGAYTSALRRTTVGSFDEAQAMPIEGLSATTILASLIA